MRNEHPVEVTSAWADVTDLASLRTFFASCANKQQIDWILVNAGVGGARPPGQPIESPETVDKLVAVNLLGGLNAIRAAVEIFDSSRRRRIIVVSSLASLAGSPENPAYAATKAAIRIACLSMRPALAKRRVSLTIAHPGFLTGRTKDGAAVWRPFAVSPECAADQIIKAGLRNKGETAFPWQMALLVKTMAKLPLGLRDRIYGRLSGDPEAS